MQVRQIYANVFYLHNLFIGQNLERVFLILGLPCFRVYFLEHKKTHSHEEERNTGSRIRLYCGRNTGHNPSGSSYAVTIPSNMLFQDNFWWTMTMDSSTYNITIRPCTSNEGHEHS